MLSFCVTDVALTVPLTASDEDARVIDLHASVVTRSGGETLPYLVFLQGGPGFEAPRLTAPLLQPSWLAGALEHYRVVLVDQRGTGRSTPVGAALLEAGDAVAAEYLTHFRADAIVRDCEAIREHLGVDTWSVLGQSFGGFTTLSYLSRHADRLDEVYCTGGLSSVGTPLDEVYSGTYEKMRLASERYYRRFPEDRSRMRRLAERAGSLQLPGGEVLSRSRLRSLGHLLGSNDGWASLHHLLMLDIASDAFAYDLEAALPFSARNPLYFLLQEACWADGGATRWAAERSLPAAFVDDATLLTGEHVFRDWLDTVPWLRPWSGVAEALAEHEWPRLYDEEALRDSGAVGAAAVWFNDVYVPVEPSLRTAALMPGVHAWVTSEHEHNGLRAGADTLERLIDLAHGRRLR